MFINGNKLEAMINYSKEYDQTKKCTYRQRLALISHQKQRQRPAKWW